MNEETAPDGSRFVLIRRTYDGPRPVDLECGSLDRDATAEDAERLARELLDGNTSWSFVRIVDLDDGGEPVGGRIVRREMYPLGGLLRLSVHGGKSTVIVNATIILRFIGAEVGDIVRGTMARPGGEPVAFESRIRATSASSMGVIVTAQARELGLSEGDTCEFHVTGADFRL